MSKHNNTHTKQPFSHIAKHDALVHAYIPMYKDYTYVCTHCAIINIQLITAYVYYVPFVVCHLYSFSSYLHPLLHMVLVVDLWYLQFPENKFELLYNYVTRFARRGLIHAQFKDTLLSLFNSWRINSYYKVISLSTYAMNVIILVKPYRYDISAVIWHSSKL